MLLPENVHPANSLYFNGAHVLSALKKIGETDPMGLFIESRKLHEMQLPLFTLTLDWLYLAGMISCNRNGNIELCS